MEPWALPLRYAPLHPYPGLSSPGHIFSLSYKCFITGLGPLSCLAPTLSPRSSWKLLPNRTITPPPSLSPWPQLSVSLPTWPLWALAGSCHSSLCLPASHPHPLPPGRGAVLRSFHAQNLLVSWSFTSCSFCLEKVSHFYLLGF